MRNRTANFTVLASQAEWTLIQDVGPWEQYPTITNAAEQVVEQMVKAGMASHERRLFYLDSYGELAELAVSQRGQFAGFRAVTDGDPLRETLGRVAKVRP